MFRETLTFDDVLLVPQYSEILPRDVSVSSSFLSLPLPFLSAAMDRVTESRMALALAQQGGLGVLHKSTSIAQQCAWVCEVKSAVPEATAALDGSGRLRVGAAVGIGSDGLSRAAALLAAGVDALFLDSAHGHSANVLRLLSELRSLYPEAVLVAGNVATGEGTRALVDAGASAVKVGIGPGSICTTRVVAGVGVPQLTAILDCVSAAAGRVPVIADGGMKTSGDVVKALAAGASAVMFGNLFAGCEESPGRVVAQGDRFYKEYRGMGSQGAMLAGSGDRYFQEGYEAPKLVAEGVEGLVLYKGSLSGVLHPLLGGLRAGMGYLGASDLMSLRARASFVRITAAGFRESRVHSLEESSS